MEITEKAINGLERAVYMYEEFAEKSPFPDEQGRLLEELKARYLDKQMAVVDVASLFQVSDKCVYVDIKKVQEWLAELFEITEGKWQEGLDLWKN